MTTKAYPGTQSVVRALRLLKLFHGGPELSFGEVLERAGLNRSTVFRILTALEAEGMLVRDPERDAYRLGPEIAALGRHATGGPDLNEIAQREMESLAQALHETVTLETLAGEEVVIVAEAMGDHVLGVLPSLGTSWPAHLTSTGKVLLAALDESERARWLPAAVRRRRVFADELRRVQRQGWAASLEELEPGYVAVAVPVLDAAGRTVAALSVGGPGQRLPRRRLVTLARELKRSSRDITRKLGN